LNDGESQDLDFLIEIFGWPNEPTHRYHALKLLRWAREDQSPMPTFDDFKVGIVR